MKQTILIVEDDKNLAKLTRYNLEKAGYDCFSAYSGEEALDILEKQSINLILLDIMLPGIDGLETCRIIKRNKELSHILVVMLTAKGEEVDKVVGFELGADDYVVKPFSVRELVLRVKALLRRQTNTIADLDQEIIKAANLKIDIERHEVVCGNKEIELTPKEFYLLVTLIKRKGRVQSRERLLNDVWELSSDVYTRTVDTHIKRLREKLGKTGEMIQTVTGVGYRFVNDED